MNARYFKILIILTLFLLIVIVSASIRINSFGANTAKKKEIISRSAKREIENIFYREKSDKIDSLMEEKASKYYFNGNVLVGYKGNCIYAKSFGYADMLRKKQLKKDDIFQLASVSKQFTAMAIMILKEWDQLSYDDTVANYISEFPYPRITVRMLLNHTSGLPNYMWLVEHHWKGKNAPYNTDIAKMIAEHKLPLYFKPGSRWDYSNTGYIILATIVEKISGKAFSDFMDENIFEPLDMNNSFAHSNLLSNKKGNILIGYHYRGRRYRTIPETINDGAVGDKGIYSTTEDLFKWDQALYNNLLVSAETMNEAISTFKLRNKYEIHYGFGFRIKKANDKKVAYHHGKWNGFRTSIMRYVEDTNTVIVLNHTSSSLNRTIVSSIQQILADSLNSNATRELVNSILDEGLDNTVESYLKNFSGKNNKLDTVKLVQVSKILFKQDNPITAEKILLFKDMYVNGELDNKSINDRRFLSFLSIKGRI